MSGAHFTYCTAYCAILAFMVKTKLCCNSLGLAGRSVTAGGLGFQWFSYVSLFGLAKPITNKPTSIISVLIKFNPLTCLTLSLQPVGGYYFCQWIRVLCGIFRINVVDQRLHQVSACFTHCCHGLPSGSLPSDAHVLVLTSQASRYGHDHAFVELLLLYSEVNRRTGNTPLHVCGSSDQPGCTKVCCASLERVLLVNFVSTNEVGPPTQS